MAYCTYQDVQHNLQYLVLKPDSKPSIDDVTAFCEQVAADIDARLNAAGISLPVENPGKLVLLGKIAADGVTARIFRSFNTEQALESAKAFQEEYDKAIQSITTDPLIIEAASLSASPGYLKTERENKYQREDRNW